MNENIANEVVVGFGEALWDMLPDGRQIGGAPANFAYNVAQWGPCGYVVSGVGKDQDGQDIIDNFTDKKMNFILERVPYPTGTVQVRLGEDGMPAYEIREGVAWDNIPCTDRILELAARTQVVSFGSLGQRCIVSRDCLHKFLDAMPKDNDHYVVFDVNLRQNFYTREILCDSMERCNVMKINDEELVIISRMFGYPGIDLKDKCWILLGKYNLGILILTCGVNGSYVFTPGHMSFLPTPRVDVVDTIGAGDSFSAVFMVSILRGCTIEQAHQNAVTASAYVCTQAGAMPPVPQELREKIHFPD